MQKTVLDLFLPRVRKRLEHLLSIGATVLYFPLLLSLLVACSSGRVTKAELFGGDQPLPEVKEKDEEILEADADWVETTLGQLSLEEKIGQMVMPSSRGYYISEDSEEFERLMRLVKEKKVGGLIFFQGNVFETAFIINKLQAAADLPLLISADFERGVAMRIENTTSFPYIMALGAARDPGLAYEMGKVIAREGRALGVHQNYAPVVDVNNNPRNPTINVRAFGEDPRLVSEMSAAFTKGLHDGRMISTAKHFPGHGDTNVDSHSDLPVLGFDRKRIEAVELAPFREAIDRGVMSIMVGHLSLPAYDTVRGIPATLSPNIVTKLLKNDLDFKGLIVTDAMNMQGVTKSFSLAEAAVLAVKAGNDIVLMPPDEEVAIDALISAVRRGEISVGQVDASVRKVLNLKAWLDVHKNRYVSADTIFAVVGSKSHQRLAREIARRSITLVKDQQNLLPFEKLGSKKLVSLVISDNTSPTTGDRFNSQLRSRYGNLQTLRIDTRSNAEEYDSVWRVLKAADVIICPTYVRVRSGQGSISLQPQQVKFIERVLKSGKPVIAISLGSPYVLSEMKDVGTYLCAYSDVEVAIDAAVEALFGEIDVDGKLPVSIPGLYKYGWGISLKKTQLRVGDPELLGFDSGRLKKLDTIMKKAIADSAFPGGVLVIAKDGVIMYNKAFGTYDYSPYSRLVTTGTMYDVASLTKVLVTASSVMKLLDEKKITLDDPVAKYLPAFGQSGKDRVTIKNLLLHNSGLPAWKKFYETCLTAQQLLDSLYATPLVYATGDSTVYSDLGMIVLGKLVEEITGLTLDRYAAKEFFVPLRMESTMFNPPESYWNRIAPTEVDTVWRKDKFPVRGRVHDENATVLGGISGHAGLFSTGSDLAVMMQLVMNGGTYAGKRYLAETTVRMFTTKQRGQSTRTLGWDTKTMQGYSSAGSLFSSRSFGHTGFTGTSIWVDPERNLFVILLTNRVHPTRENTKIHKIRPVIHDGVINALKTQPQSGAQ